MNPTAITILEYDKIIEKLVSLTTSGLGRSLAEELRPYQELHVINEELDATTEAVELITHKGPLPIGGFYDIRRHLSHTKKGGSLTMGELLDVMTDLSIAEDITGFMAGDDVPDVVGIKAMTDLIVTVPALRDEIDRCIISEDEISDNASPKLKEIRREIGKQNEAIRAKLSKLITAADTKSLLQDSIVTMRDGRYVIPVKQEHRQKVPGMIHDQSRGGQTVFIEPQAVVELNNSLRELEIQEEQEIARILAELSSRTGEHYDELLNNQTLIGKLDFIMAKGKLSGEMMGNAPIVGQGRDSGTFGYGDSGGSSTGATGGTDVGTGAMYLKLIKARHPLIEPDKVIPIDIELGGDYTSLIITGPNTGGKTVTLKTVGLLSLMAMSGLHIPAEKESRVPIYREIYADIGDEQSIEQSLSTFSSHMKSIVGIIRDGDEKALVLLDELGAGTDPTEGAALAIAVLDRLREQGASVLATTHYNELKKYALSTPGVQNASMEFNVDTLSPTYKLMMGIPGKSNAFEISRKLGLDGSIIDRAAELIDRGDMEFEDVIGSIARDRSKAEYDRIEAEGLLAKARAQDEYLRAKEEDFVQKRDEILNKARAEAREIVREARNAAKEAQKEIQRDLKDTANISRTREKLRQLENSYAVPTMKQINSEPVSAEDLEIGDRVKVLTLDQNGEVLSLPDDKGNLTVLVGSIKISVKLEDLMLINEGKDRKKPIGQSKGTRAQVSVSSKSRSVSPSLNVQGENLQDALMDVEKYIDDVYMAGLPKVTIIHGRGEGILKNGIRDMLARHKLVASALPGVYNEGGEGVTIVTMKKE